ncbi:MAG TPA: hypothetical protein ENJ95_12605 [Bacteroidetes bacterium]|nr:hypothetical protein [Bacteroidota bacterium]
MKKSFFLFLLCLTGTLVVQAQNLQPYTIGAETTGSVAEVSSKAKAALSANGIEVVGEYMPAGDADRKVIAITSSDLKTAVNAVGGLTGFAAVLRVAVTKEGDKVIVSYTTPEYWGNAYFQKNYGKVSSNYASLSGKLKAALNPLGSNGGTGFGSEDGLSAGDLQKYHYMLGMPYFEDNHELNEFASYQEAVAKIDGNLVKGVANLKKVYAVELPGKNIKLYGIGLSGEDGESSFMPTIDIASPKHTAFLPYEMLVLDNKVYMLHGRFRIALSFPDLSMGTFMKIVSTPKDIKKMLTSATE